jgi:hypothetical protein
VKASEASRVVGATGMREPALLLFLGDRYGVTCLRMAELMQPCRLRDLYSPATFMNVKLKVDRARWMRRRIGQGVEKRDQQQ